MNVQASWKSTHKFPNSTEKKLLLLGLDAAGKTSLLYRLKLCETVHTIPTVGFNVESVAYKNLNFVIWDVGGQEGIRTLWTHYFQNSSAIIFIVDSADPDRFSEARDELQRLGKEKTLKTVPLLVFANKCDMPQSVNPLEVVEKLELEKFSDTMADKSFRRSWKLFKSSCMTGEGLYEGLNWLSQEIQDEWNYLWLFIM